MSMDHKSVAKFYDEEYYKYFGRNVGSPTRHLKKLMRRLNIKPQEKVLDIACGTGEWLSAVTHCGAAVAGIDISSRAIDMCRQRLPQGEFFVGVAEKLPFPDAEFDVVTCLGSLEHFVDQPSALREMVRVVVRWQVVNTGAKRRLSNLPPGPLSRNKSAGSA